MKKIAILLFLSLASCQLEEKTVVTTVINKQVGDGEDGFFKRYGIVALSNGGTLQPTYGVYNIMNIGDTVTMVYRGGHLRKVDCSCITQN